MNFTHTFAARTATALQMGAGGEDGMDDLISLREPVAGERVQGFTPSGAGHKGGVYVAATGGVNGDGEADVVTAGTAGVRAVEGHGMAEVAVRGGTSGDAAVQVFGTAGTPLTTIAIQPTAGAVADLPRPQAFCGAGFGQTYTFDSEPKSGIYVG